MRSTELPVWMILLLPDDDFVHLDAKRTTDFDNLRRHPDEGHHSA